MADFAVGDRVETLDDTIKGTIVAIHSDRVTIETEEGFPLDYPPSDLVRIVGRFEVSRTDLERVRVQEATSGKKRRPAPKKKERNAPAMEVDLHIHQLTKSTHGMTNFDMLNLQLETAKRQLEFAIGKRIQKMVFIHGVGEGVLREELYTLFRRYENVRYYDADFRKYGVGATEVYIHQNM